MTFPTSFYNIRLIHASLKRNRHVMIVETIALFLASSLIIILQHAQQGKEAFLSSENYVRSFQGLNIFSIILLCIFPIIIACFEQSYLYQKRSIAFYHSQPFTRTQLYISHYISGFLTFFIPLVLIFLCNSIIYFVLGFHGKILYASLVQGLFISLLFYTILYSVSVFSATLSGNVIAQIFMIIFTFSIIPAMEGMMQFCITCWYDKIPFQEFRSLLYAFPMLYLSKILSPYSSFFLADIFYCVGYALLFAIAGAFCYRARKSEDCHKFYVFIWVKRMVKYCVSFLSAVLLGVIFQQIAYNHHILFMVLGFVIGGFLAFVIIQSIYEKSFRSMFANMRAFIPFCLISCMIMLFISADTFHLNNYIPERQKINAIGLSLSDEYNNHEVIFSDEKNIDTLYRIAQKGRDLSSNNSYQEVIFNYNTNSLLGHIKRIGYLDKKSFNQMVASIYDSKEYKTQYADIPALRNIKKLVNVSLEKSEYNTIYDAKESTDITKEQTIQLLKLLQQDIIKHSYADIKSSYPFANISITTHGYGLDTKDSSYVVYSCYEDTISYIRSHYPISKNAKTLKNLVISITPKGDGDTLNPVEITVTNPAWLAELIEKSYNGTNNSFQNNTPISVGKKQYNMYLTIKTSEDTYFNVSYHVLSDELQQEIKQQLVIKHS